MQFSISIKTGLIPFLATGCIIFLGFVPKVFAWDDDGHRIIAMIAQQYVSAIINKKLVDNFNIESLEKIAPWADKIKKRRDQRSWHYINIQEGELTYDQPRDCPDRQCVTEKIRDFAKILQAKKHPAQAKLEALAYLIHFMGDIHQPTHLGNKSDRGGNEIKVRYKGEPTNLHRLWDHSLVMREGKSLLQYARQLECKLDSGDHFSPSNPPVEFWANESRELALNQAYRVMFTENRELTEDYIRASREIVEQRLCRAGIRLAILLNGIFSE